MTREIQWRVNHACQFVWMAEDIPFAFCADKIIQKPVFNDSNDPLWAWRQSFHKLKTNILTDRGVFVTCNFPRELSSWSMVTTCPHTNEFTSVCANRALFDPTFGHSLQAHVPMQQIHIGDTWNRFHRNAISQTIVSKEKQLNFLIVQFQHTWQLQFATITLVDGLLIG